MLEQRHASNIGSKIPHHMTGSLQLREYPGEGLANIESRNLIERYGADIWLPDLREEIAQDACMVRYVDLGS